MIEIPRKKPAGAYIGKEDDFQISAEVLNHFEVIGWHVCVCYGIDSFGQHLNNAFQKK